MDLLLISLWIKLKSRLIAADCQGSDTNMPEHHQIARSGCGRGRFFNAPHRITSAQTGGADKNTDAGAGTDVCLRYRTGRAYPYQDAATRKPVVEAWSVWLGGRFCPNCCGRGVRPGPYPSPKRRIAFNAAMRPSRAFTQ